MKLWEYEGKYLRIIDVDGDSFVGRYDYYTSELDAPDGIASLTIRPLGSNPDKILIQFTESEIASIEIIAVNDPIMAEAI